MATCVQPCSANQPDSASRPGVVVSKVRTFSCDLARGGDANGGDHVVFVHIQTSTARIENVHDPLLVDVPPPQDTRDEKV